MNKQTVKVSGTGISFTSALQIVFIVLKLCKVINWSWWIVLLPTLINAGIIILGLIIACIYYIYITRNE